MSNSESIEKRAHRGTWQSLRVTFDAAAERLPQALQAEGFGIITQIDLQQTFKAKLGADFRRYRIFGACNPAFALKAVEADPRAGLILCNSSTRRPGRLPTWLSRSVRDSLGWRRI